MNNNFLIDTKRELNDKEAFFRDKFVEIFSKSGWLLQDEERFAQCLETSEGCKYYNPEWFVSNYGYIISVARKGIILKQTLKTGGLRGTSEDDRWTDYVKSICATWEKDKAKGYRPQFYFYVNWYPKYHGLADTEKLVISHKVVALYHCPNGHLVLDNRYDVHHKIPFNWDKAPQYSNRADNLQCLLEDDTATVTEHPERRQHKVVHNADVGKKETNELMEKAFSPEVTNVWFQPGGIEKFVLAGLKINPTTAIGVSFKNEDGSTYKNVYYSGSDAKPIDD